MFKMKDDNQSDVQSYQLTAEQIKDFVNRSQDKHVKMIWNGAIEEVAVMAENRYGNYSMIANEIRMLKK
jgi:hypothetical protein